MLDYINSSGLYLSLAIKILSREGKVLRFKSCKVFDQNLCPLITARIEFYHILDFNDSRL